MPMLGVCDWYFAQIFGNMKPDFMGYRLTLFPWCYV